jgi:glycosyltransferase involved in cell wall biosynthesis
MNYKLAIVIPFYKAKFFQAALASIASQTNKNFRLYISDDNSKEDITPLIEHFKSKLDLEYYRFKNNLGKDNLVEHWNRSVRLAKEEWIWLFSDDDVMDEGCVQAFYDALDKTEGQHDIYRFNIKMIDANDKVICIKDPHPPTETGYEFLIRRLQSKSLSAAVEYIFKKEVFEKNNGFVNFPLAYCSDDASWITFVNRGEIYTILHLEVYWRASNINISSVKGLQYQKTNALLEYCLWVKNRLTESVLPDLETWFFENLKYVYGKLSVVEKFIIAKRLASIFNKNKFNYFLKLLLNSKV